MASQSAEHVPDYLPLLQRLRADYPGYPADKIIIISVDRQRLYLFDRDRLLSSWPVSTSKLGTGMRQGSDKTPLGVHYVREKIGADAPPGTIFRGRRDTGKVADILKTRTPSPEDLVTSRILWLSGLEPGVNEGGDVDSFHRYIYIHGTDEEGFIGTPASHGCVRMRNADVISLFRDIPPRTLVDIVQ
ncbi:MAG: L,D-transpeptidase [Gammaproteobacteria bacterium]